MLRCIYDDIGKILTFDHQIIDKEISLDEFRKYGYVLETILKEL